MPGSGYASAYISLCITQSSKYLVRLPNSAEKVSPCQCTKVHPCDLDICINRATLTECYPDTCPVKHPCQNQRMQKQQYADTVTYLTKNTGWGLKAIHDIKNGEFVIEFVGEVISKEMYSKRGNNCYVFALQPGLYIDVSLKGSLLITVVTPTWKHKYGLQMAENGWGFLPSETYLLAQN